MRRIEWAALDLRIISKLSHIDHFLSNHKIFKLCISLTSFSVLERFKVLSVIRQWQRRSLEDSLEGSEKHSEELTKRRLFAICILNKEPLSSLKKPPRRM